MVSRSYDVSFSGILPCGDQRWLRKLSIRCPVQLGGRELIQIHAGAIDHHDLILRKDPVVGEYLSIVPILEEDTLGIPKAQFVLHHQNGAQQLSLKTLSQECGAHSPSGPSPTATTSQPASRKDRIMSIRNQNSDVVKLDKTITFIKPTVLP